MDIEKAVRYYNIIRREHQCGVPQQRVVPVQEIHPSNSKIYITDSVVLHQCAYDTGCCCPTGETCAPSIQVEIHLPIIIQKYDGSSDFDYQMMTFHNHTMCACKSIQELRKAKMNDV